MKPVLLLLLCLLAVPALNAAPPKGKPNIIFILADDLGYGDVGCYNSEAKVATPNIDRLAREGMRFTDAHAPSTVCTPSRYSLLTGRMAFRIPYRSVFEGVGGPCLIKEDQLTLPQLLRNQGYTTAMTGKWHVGLTFLDKDGKRITQGGIEGVRQIDYSRAIPDAPIHRGFDQFFGTACCPATDYLYAFIDGDRIPVPPTGVLDKSGLPKHPYANDNRVGMLAPGYDLEDIDMVFLKKSQAFLEQHQKTSPNKPFFLLHSMNAVHLPSFAAKRFQGSTKAGPHGDFIHELDVVVGELMQTLKRLGLDKNTVVMFSSDNGPETTSVAHMRADYGHDGARPWRGVKRDQWEGGHRVPFLVRWPGTVAAGSKNDQTVCLTDVMATCAAITGATLPDNAAQDSFDLLPLLRSDKSAGQVRPYTLHQTISLALAIRKGSWKYLDHKGSGGNNYDNPELKRYALPDTAPDAPGQLYNLETDPGETTNLYFKYPEIVKELKALLESSKAQGRSTVPPATNRYNVLFIAVDDLRPELACYGVKEAQTPNLDRLAKSGVLFTRHYATVPTCGASRYALLTGRSPRNTGVTANNEAFYPGKTALDPNLLPGAQSLPEQFRRSGYQSVCIGKVSHTADGRVYAYNGKGDGHPELPHAWDALPTPFGAWQRGWGIFFAYAGGKHREDGQGHNALMEFTAQHDEDLPDGQLAREAIAQIKGFKSTGKPFFLGLGFFKPHLPFVAPKQDWDAFEGKPISLPSSPLKPDVPYWHPSAEFYKYALPFAKTQPLDDDAKRLSRRAYLACVRYTDRQVGKVLDALKAEGLEKNTIVVLWGDHGWHLGEQQIWGKHSPFERAVRSTLIVRAPGIGPTGKVSDALIESIDLYPTLTELCQPRFTQTHHPLDGKSFAPVLAGKTPTVHDTAISYWEDTITIRTATHRLIARRTKDGTGFKDIALYDLTKGLDSTENLADKNPALTQELLRLSGRGLPIR